MTLQRQQTLLGSDLAFVATCGTCPCLAVNNSQRRAFVQAQIELRIGVLEGWLGEGAPAGQRVPVSLTQVRTWDDPSLGIVPIGSSATFTTTHRAHGGFVIRISQVLRDLHTRRSPGPRGKKENVATQRAFAAHKRKLEGAANQYAAMRVEFDEAAHELRVAKQSLDAVRAENAELRAKNAELRANNAEFRAENRRLAREPALRSRPAAVTDLDSRRVGTSCPDGS